ncbi:single-stranded-DNA-specific exonuclease RecJ [Thiovulum sp. ES]|nr:single-stranded-DNA-specific exonuclease RecJ [Thiovulum sp. ES]
MISAREIEKKLQKRFDGGFKSLSDIPHPSLLKDSDIASERIAKAIFGKEKIVVIGDYDVDGVVSSAIAHLFFREINFPVEIVIPNRFSDGYGVSPELLEKVDADLVITVDNGIHAFRSAQILKERGTDFIITDHHNPSDKLPDALAIVNPKREDCPYPYKEICGAEVIWLLLGEVKRVLGVNVDMGKFLHLIAIATVADVMPITNLNHSIVKNGLKILSKSNEPFVQVFRKFAKNGVFTSEDIAFQISPRLNASGRMLDATLSFQFLISENLAEANELFFQIDELNSRRKEIEKEMFDEVSKNIDLSNEILMYSSKNMHEGIVGIVASRIVETFQKPTILFSERDGIIKGSARSLGNIDIFEILKDSNHLFLKWGGHKMVGGLSLELDNLQTFQQRANSLMQKYADTDFENSDETFGKIDLKNLNLNLLQTIDKFQPFGEQNRKPNFELHNVFIKDKISIGKEKDYQKLTLQNGDEVIKILVFRKSRNFEIGENISIIFEPTINEFRGKTSIEGFFVKEI